MGKEQNQYKIKGLRKCKYRHKLADVDDSYIPQLYHSTCILGNHDSTVRLRIIEQLLAELWWLEGGGAGEGQSTKINFNTVNYNRHR